ncbi:MAG: hypothetical protein JRN52_04640 [Nitrososphaerota archaeon]|nr:hypothetical protein [Nitrososphaerota archaeon]
MKQVLVTESFQWAQQLWPILKRHEDDGVCFYEVLANHADIKNRNGRIYTDEQLRMAAASLSERPLNINHDERRTLPFPENQVLVARYEDGRVECIIQVADRKANQMIQSGEINSVSIEGVYLDGSRNTPGTEYPTSLHFQALALLNDDLPGDPDARILRENALRPNAVRIPAVIAESILVPKNCGDNFTMSQEVVKEESWSAKDIDNLPDDAFAYIEKGGKKDEEGKTVPRALRHLPYKGPNGKPDAAHVRNALARLPQTQIPDAAKAEANSKLQAAAKELGIETEQMRSKESLLEERISRLEARLSQARLSDDAADDSDADRDAIVDPKRNEDGTFASGQSLQPNQRGKPQASDATPKNENPTQTTQTNVEIGREIPGEGSAPKMMQSLQNSSAAQIEGPNMNSAGVGNPESTIRPKMDYPIEVNPLAITNQNPSPISDGMKVTKASNFTDALTNASTNVSVRVIPTGVSESSMTQVTNQSEKSMSAQESTQVKESVSSQSQAITVRLEGASEIKQAAETFANLMKESQIPKPQAKVSSTETVQEVKESTEVKETARFEKVAKALREMANVREDLSSAVSSGALGQVWSPDMIVLPPDLPANLRRFVQVKEIPRGSKQVNFTTITTPEFASLTEDTVPTDVSQTITEISATPAETGAKQRVSYVTMESATPDVVQAVERAFQAAALIDEDNTILAALDAATPADTLYGDESVTSENSITSSMTFKGARLASALREIQKKGYAINPGDLVAVLHPVQYDALLKDTAISQYLYFGSAGPIQQGVIPQVYGVDVVRSTKIPTGMGAGSPAITTYHAQVFLKAQAKGGPTSIGIGGSCAMAVSRQLMIETWRKIDERSLVIVASHRIATAVLQPNALVHVYTA